MHWLASATNVSTRSRRTWITVNSCLARSWSSFARRSAQLSVRSPRRADRDVDLVQLVVQAEHLDDVALLASLLEQRGRWPALVHLGQVFLSLGQHLLGRQRERRARADLGLRRGGLVLRSGNAPRCNDARGTYNALFFKRIERASLGTSEDAAQYRNAIRACQRAEFH